MTQLTELHPVAKIVREKVPHVTAMGIMAGYAGKFASRSRLRGIRFILDRMSATTGDPHDMGTLGNRFMT